MTDMLKLSINTSSSKSNLISLIFLLNLVFLASLLFSVNDNKKITIKCNKIENTCTFKVEKFLFKTKEYTKPFNSLNDADVYVDGSSRGIRHYAFVIPSSQGALKLFTISNNKAYLAWLADNFNDAKNNSSINDFVILPPKQVFMTISVFNTLILLAVILFLIFFIGYKETIIVDKAEDKIKIILHRLVWSKSKIIKVSQIANINLKQENNGFRYLIEYTLINGKKRKLFYMLYPSMTLSPIYSQLALFLFNKEKQQETQNISKSWIDKYLEIQ